MTKTYPYKRKKITMATDELLEEPYYLPGTFCLKEGLAIRPKNNQEAAKYLVKIVTEAVMKKSRLFYANENKNGNKNDWVFYHNLHTHSQAGNEILIKLFGSIELFLALPFIEYPGTFYFEREDCRLRMDCYYKFRFDLLEYFAENGMCELLEKIEREKIEIVWKNK